MRHNEYMRAALDLAKEAAAAGEIPVGCVVVGPDGRIIGRGRNRREADKSVVGHAEIEAMLQAERILNNWRLDGCSLYVTLEPCPMCAGAMINARLGRLYYGARDSAMGACGGVMNLFMENFGHSPQIFGGILAEDCSMILSDFFRSIRRAADSSLRTKDNSETLRRG